MATAYIGIGSNLGDRLANLETARRALAQLAGTRVAAWSHVYETEPVGPVAQGKFLNAAARLETELDAPSLRRELAKIELVAGREAQEERVKWGPRVLDLDVLLYDELVMQTPELTLPHPHMHERWFVLRPLAEVAGDVKHPLLHKTVTELLHDVEQREGR